MKNTARITRISFKTWAVETRTSKNGQGRFAKQAEVVGRKAAVGMAARLGGVPAGEVRIVK
jgi:hypothetical protein